MGDRTITVWVTRFPDRSTFQLQWVDPITGRRKTKSSGVVDTGRARDRKDAEAKARELEQLLRRGIAAIPSELSWESFRERYETEHAAGLAKETLAKIGTVCNLVEEHLAPRRLHDVTDERISRLVAILREKKKSESTIKSYLGQLKAMLRWGVSQKLLPACPTIPTIRRAKKSGGGTPMKGRPITGEEFERMLATVPLVVGEENTPEWRRKLWRAMGLRAATVGKPGALLGSGGQTSSDSAATREGATGPPSPGGTGEGTRRPAPADRSRVRHAPGRDPGAREDRPRLSASEKEAQGRRSVRRMGREDSVENRPKSRRDRPDGPGRPEAKEVRQRPRSASILRRPLGRPSDAGRPQGAHAARVDRDDLATLCRDERGENGRGMLGGDPGGRRRVCRCLW